MGQRRDHDCNVHCGLDGSLRPPDGRGCKWGMRRMAVGLHGTECLAINRRMPKTLRLVHAPAVVDRSIAPARSVGWRQWVHASIRSIHRGLWDFSVPFPVKRACETPRGGNQVAFVGRPRWSAAADEGSGRRACCVPAGASRDAAQSMRCASSQRGCGSRPRWVHEASQLPKLSPLCDELSGGEENRKRRNSRGKRREVDWNIFAQTERAVWDPRCRILLFLIWKRMRHTAQLTKRNCGASTASLHPPLPSYLFSQLTGSEKKM